MLDLEWDLLFTRQRILGCAIVKGLSALNDRTMGMMVATFERALTHELETLQRFLTEVERLIGEESRKGPLETGQMVIEIEELMDHDHDFSTGFPTVLRMSLVLMIHGLVENQLRVLLGLLRSDLGLDDFKDEKRRSWVHNAERFLRDGVKLKSDKLVQSWRPLHFYNDVRNTIAHDYGFMGLDEHRNRRVCEGISGRTDIRVDTTDRLELDVAFVSNQLEDSVRLVRVLARALYDYFNVQIKGPE